MCSVIINSINRNSFDRFGDDLCELILSYLPLSDCFVLQCVNKQFNHLIYNKQYKLVLSSCHRFKSMLFKKYKIALSVHPIYDYSEIKELIIDYDSQDDEETHESDINHQLLKYVLNKCVNINHITIDCDNICDETINIISIACKRLKRLTFNSISTEVSLNCWKDFAELSLQNLTSITVNKNMFGKVETISTLIQLCPKLNEIQYEHGIDHCIDENTVFGVNIDTVSCYYVYDQSFITFANYFAHRLKSFSVLFDIESDNKWNSFEIMKHLAKFERLEYLCIEFSGDEEEDDCIELLKLIGLKCKSLKVLDIIFWQLEIIEAFNGFKSIEKLILKDCELFDSFENLRDCVNLTHLVLDNVYSVESNFENIHIYLPQIKSIDFFYDNTDENDLIDIMKHLEKMLNLCDLKFGCNDEKYKVGYHCVIRTNYVISFIDNCLSIRRIGIYSEVFNKTLIEDYIESNNRKIVINTLIHR